MSRITELDEIISFDGEQYYTIIAKNGENKKVKITNLLVISLENFEVLKTITIEKINEWNNKSDFNENYVTKEEYESLVARVEALENNNSNNETTEYLLSDINGNYLSDINGNYLLFTDDSSNNTSDTDDVIVTNYVVDKEGYHVIDKEGYFITYKND